MTTYVVFGDQPAADKLVKATLNDYLDTYLNDDEDGEDFNLVIATRARITPVIDTVLSWCEKSGVYFEVFIPSENTAVRPEADAWTVTDSFLIDAVEAGYSYSGSDTVVLALVGEAEPTADVTRAIARAVDSRMVVRDLTEGALTYIKFHGDAVEDTPSSEDEPMSEEEQEVTLDELVSMADNDGDADAQEALEEAAREYGIDPDAYATYAEVGELLEAAMSAEEEEPEPEPEPEEEEPAAGEGGWDLDSLKSMTLKEVREHAAQAGIDDAKTAPRAKLVKALIEGTAGDAPEEEAPAPKAKKAKKEKAPPSDGDVDLDALADAIIDRLIARLS